jgi:multimeric flavodoxin WrbA
MRVLLINGSPRREGNTFLALSEIAKVLEQEGIESEIVGVGTRAVRGCIACNTCKQHGDNRCIFDDDICNEVSARMAKCDAVIVGSPVYYGQPNGTVLSLLQRMFYSAGKYFEGKPAAAVAVCRRGGATAAFQTLQMPFQMMNMPIVTSQYWNIVYGREAGQAALDAEGMQTMRTLAHNLAWMIRGLRGENAPSLPEREAWQPMHFIR